MTINHPALAPIATPALVVDEPVLRANIAAMAAFARDRDIALRPHVKTHKSSLIARMQMEAGARGVACATVAEAEMMIAGGLRDVLVTSPVAEPGKVRRLATLAREAKFTVVVDHPTHVALLAAADAPFDVLIDVDLGQRRTGVAEIEAGVALAKRITGSLRLTGLQGFGGHIQHMVDAGERRAAAHAASDHLDALRRAIEAEGLRCDVVSGSGTGAYAYDASGAYTELQVGSYLFMDADYRRLAWEKNLPFQQSLFVLATVVSANRPGQVTVDAGVKALAFNGPPPDILLGVPEGARYQFAGDEHGVIILPDRAEPPKIGARILIGATHCDPTVNLHAAFHLLSPEGVKRVPLEGRYA
ncbi:alanine racemase [Aquabacter sp. CN5-332]|uniref:alanine racemase n=1 Tax=Aquabacter sp. CN5-332 TaxID=3156608 RepID=UPI0032B33B93